MSHDENTTAHTQTGSSLAAQYAAAPLRLRSSGVVVVGPGRRAVVRGFRPVLRWWDRTNGTASEQERPTKGTVLEQESPTKGTASEQESPTKGTVLEQESPTKGTVLEQESPPCLAAPPPSSPRHLRRQALLWTQESSKESLPFLGVLLHLLTILGPLRL